MKKYISNMKEIKQIRIEDCVECYVEMLGNICITKNSDKAYIAFKTNDGFVDFEGDFYRQAIPCEELDNPKQPKWSDKYPAEWSLDAKIFKALNQGAVIRIKGERIPISYMNFTVWDNISLYQICTNYTGTDSDVWEEIE